MTTSSTPESTVDATLKQYQRSRKIAYVVSISGIAISLVLTLLGQGPWNSGTPLWLKAVEYFVIFAPILHLSISRDFMRGESADARAAGYSGPPRSSFSIHAPTALKGGSTAVFVVPAMILVMVVVLFVVLGQFVIETMMSSGVSFEMFNMVFIGFTAVVVGLLAWTVAVFVQKDRVEKVFRAEVDAELSRNGFTWGKREFPVDWCNYTQDNPAVLIDSESRSSHWTIEWDGENAVVAPLEPVP